MPRRSKKTQGAADPLEAALDEIGDQWTFLLLREAFFGVRRFEQFARGLAIPRARLTERLQHLVAVSILERRPYLERPPRFEYRLTAKGLDTYSIALTLMAWGDRWRNDPSAGPRLRLTHRTCGKRLRPRMACSECDNAITLDTVEWPTVPKLGRAASSVGRWRRLDSFGEISERNDSVAKALEAIGDRWSMKLVHRAARGTLRFAELQEQLGIATNTLTDRLRSLADEEVLERGPGSGRGSTGYTLTRAGSDLAPVLFAVRAWGARWLVPEQAAPLLHASCGNEFEAICRCATCGEPVDPREVAQPSRPNQWASTVEVED